MDTRPDVGHAIAAAARTIHQKQSLDETLQAFAPLSEGPCDDTLRDAQIVAVPRIQHDQRWPRYVPAAVESGFRLQLAVRLYLDEEGTLGGLNLCSTTSGEIDPEAEASQSNIKLREIAQELVDQRNAG